MKQIYYTIQTLLRGRGSNLIKVLSLGLSLTMTILLFSRVAYERSFDTCYQAYDRLYQVWSIFTVNGKEYLPQKHNCGPVAGAMLESFPQEIEAATSLCTWWSDPLYVGNTRFNTANVCADSLFFQTMGVEVLCGQPVQDLQQSDVVFLCRSIAEKMFGDENPIGKVVSYGHQLDLTVRGTFEDIPDNATCRPQAVISLPSLLQRGQANYSWSGGDSWIEYVRFRDESDAEAVNSRMDAMIAKYRSDEEKKMYGYSAYVAPIRDTYQQSEEVRMMTGVMLALGFAILFIATLNYVLISLASLSRRAKAIGVHKCSGASGMGILGMFLLETAFLLLAALLLMGVLLYAFRDFVEDTASVSLQQLFAPERLWVVFGVVAFLFVVGGVLPGRLFARIPVTQVFRRYTEGKKGWKRPLLFVQFAGVAFICGLMCVVTGQYRYVLGKDMGYRPERMAIGYAELSPDERDAALQFFKNLPYVEAVSSACQTPIWGYSGSMVQDEAGRPAFSTRFCFYMREDYPALMGWTFLEGRMARTKEEVVVNECFAEKMHWGNEVIGRKVNCDGCNYTVTGLLEDFQIGSFTEEPMPFVAAFHSAFFGTVHVRLKEPFADNLKRLNKEVAEAFPTRTMDFVGMEQEIADRYASLRIFSQASLVAAVTMLFVMLMGLLGYTADEVRRRSKEIAIRKVNGAESAGILRLLGCDVLVVAVPAVLVGSVAAWYVNRLWMDAYQVQISLTGAIYLLVALGVLAVIVGCVLMKSWRIANENPVLSIKSE
ncbi:MAG: FtsX-like permease family protein [Mediterranea sp.]|nr:FtsX-like permease family protein [Mediterranea sp.]